MKMKHILWILPVVLLSVTACQKQDGERGSSAEGHISETAETAATLEPADTADSKENAKPDYAPAIADGYQFVKNLGICKPDHPVIYMIEKPETAGITNDYANARLTDVFYQDKMLVIKLVLEDTSISVIPADEVEQLLKKEQENYEKQERGEAANWDNSYFCIDMEEKIYGRSRFWEVLNGNNPNGSNRLVDARLFPPGLSESGYGFQTQTFHTDYKEYEDGWHSIITAELELRNVPFTKEELGEIFELKLSGFDTALSFRLQAAKEVPELKELPGWTETEGMSFLVYGEADNQDLTIFWYPFREDDSAVSPVAAEVSYRTAGSEAEKTCPLQLYGGRSNLVSLFDGLDSSGMRKFTCRLPVEQEIQEVKLVLDHLTVSTNEQSGIYPIPIPETMEDLDLNVGFRDGTLHLTKVERMTEEISLGQEADGSEILKPGIYLTARAEGKTEGMHMGIVLGYEADFLDKNGEIDRYRRGPVYPHVTDQPIHACEVKGYRIPYEPDAKEVDILFWNPNYLLEQQFVLPVVFDNP